MDEAFVSARPRVKIGAEERADLGDALQSVIVNLPLHGMAHGELTFNCFAEGEEDQAPDFQFTDIGFGERVQIAFGEDSELRVFDGEITGIEERYGGGSPRLVLLMQDVLHRLARTRGQRAFDDQSPDEVVQAIADDAGLETDINVSTAAGTWHQLNESDLAFLFRILSPFGIAVRIHNGVLRARAEEPDSRPVLLDSEDNALRIRLLADLAHQPVETRVLGYSAADEEDLNGTCDAITPAPAGSSAADLLGELGWGGGEIVPQPFAFKGALADSYARGHFERRARAFVTGEIQCVGNPVLRSGREIELEGVSERMSGTYRVVHCTHSFESCGGFRTRLRVTRGGWGG